MTNKRVDDLEKALRNGRHTNGNHTITTTTPGIIQNAEWCKDCDKNLTCYLQHNLIDPYTAIQLSYPCATENRYVRFFYHNTECLAFDRREKCVNDWGYWGYSVTTSRSIRWYLEALFEHGFINSRITIADAIKFFKKRKRNVISGDHTAEWFSTK